MKAAIIQSNYIPWKGYFDIIHDVDVFILLDDAQYTVRDWRNRNAIKTARGPHWLTVPVLGGRHQRICDVRIDSSQDWRGKHLGAIRHSYGRSPHFAEVYPRFEAALTREYDRLVDLNSALIRDICGYLGIRTRILDASDMACAGSKDEKLIELCVRAGADAYLSGPAARDYIRPERFEEAGIALAYKDYSGYPEYPQFFPPFVHGVSILDLLFHAGPAAPEYIWGRREAGHGG